MKKNIFEKKSEFKCDRILNDVSLTTNPICGRYFLL